ncbi:MAG: DUF4244 domain-containing protein [Candidatus Nanopelagicales bacterium]|jgi:hypothetical protein
MKHTITRALVRVRQDDAGMTTAEYAVGTVAAAGFGGLLIKLLTSDEVRASLFSLISSALSVFFGG